MTSPILVEVLGFSDAERHSLKTMFSLSGGQSGGYQIWTDACGRKPDVTLLDSDSDAASESTTLTAVDLQRIVITIGALAPAHAACCLPRPIRWLDLVQTLESLCPAPLEVDIDLDLAATYNTVCLVAGLLPEQRMYLRARLALAGHTLMQETESASQALSLVEQQNFDLAIVGMEVEDPAHWRVIEAIRALPQPPRSLILAAAAPTLAAMDRAHQLGCAGMLEIPFLPRQVIGVLQKIKS